MTRILQVCCDPGIAFGGPKGASVHVSELARAFVAAGAEVRVAMARVQAGAVPPLGVSVRVLPGPGDCAPLRERLAAEADRAAWLAEQAHDWRADVIYERFSLHTIAGSAAATRAGLPHLVELNAPLRHEASRYRRLDDPVLAERLERAVLADADAVLAVSRPLAAYAATMGARSPHVVPNAVDPARFPVVADAGGSPPTAVLAGSLRPWHGTDTLAEAWRLLGDGAPRLLVVGDGDGREQLTAVGARVTGRVPHDDVPGWLASAQIGLAPYSRGAPSYFSPLKLFEYLAAGLAVVAADMPGVVEILRARSDAAVIVPPGDADALASAVDALRADPARRAAMGTAGHALVRSGHTWTHRARVLLELVEILRRDRGPAPVAR